MSHVTDTNAVNRWLLIVSWMVVIMVIIGAVTRLTDSGLSMVEWRPLVGTVPPMSDAEWNRVFEKYKSFPEYQKINFEMTLSEFKRIFFWEYVHRLWGRLIGLAFVLPFIVLAIRKKISKSLYPSLIFALILGGSQGVLGWYMVKSGLINNPDVSHFRLSAHLLLAFFILAYLTYIRLALKFPIRKFAKGKPSSILLLVFCVFLIAQITYGAFTAGLDAGLTHNTFPKMGRDWIPDVVSFANIMNWEFANNVVYIQFIHRTLGWLLLVLAGVLYFRLKKVQDHKQKKSISQIGVMLVVQFILGVSTLLFYVPLSLGVLHQLGALILVYLCTKGLYFSFTDPSEKS